MMFLYSTTDIEKSFLKLLLNTSARRYSWSHDLDQTTKDIAIFGIHIGDTLESVKQQIHEPGEWLGTRDDDWSWLTFGKQGLAYGFQRDKKQETFPKKLIKPELVIQMKLYNRDFFFYSI